MKHKSGIRERGSEISNQGRESNKKTFPVPRSLLPARGFTLIEMLIVVAIIGILATFVLLGVGPTRVRARDARRISDLHQVQTALELYYGKNGVYPGTSDWQGLSNILTNPATNIGVSQIPKDPNGGGYQYASNGATYVIGATLEDGGNPVFRDSIQSNPIGGGFSCATPVYCLQF